MPKLIDLVGEKFNRWTVLEYLGKTKWRCVCDCGVEKDVYGQSLRDGTSKSCGCLNIEKVSIRSKKHGLSNHPIYGVYHDMLARCTNPKHKRFDCWGGRGIIVCDEWLDKESGFMSFYEWATNNGWDKKLQLDRRNNNGNYEPSNCRFLTPRMNSMNTRVQSNNTSGYVGVHWYKAYSNWSSSIKIHGKNIRLGYFDTRKQAVEARNNYIKQNNLTEYKIQEWRG